MLRPLEHLCDRKSAEMAFAARDLDGSSRDEHEWLSGVRELEQEWIIPFPKFG